MVAVCTIPLFHKVHSRNEKFYEFVINLRDEHGRCRILHRRYNQFFNFQHHLLDLFPNEAGAKNSSERFIPILPGKVLLRTVREREVAARRRPLLEAYCNALFHLPEYVKRHQHFVQFFACTDEDIMKSTEQERMHNVTVSDISAPSPLSRCTVTHAHATRDAHGREFSASPGDTAEVLRRTDTGYWLVDVGGRVGWFPTGFLQPLADNEELGQALASRSPCSSNDVCDIFVCIRDFTDSESGQSLSSGDLVIAQVRRDTGWWTLVGGLTLPAVNLREVAARFLDRQRVLEWLTGGTKLPPSRPPPRPPPRPPAPKSPAAPAEVQSGSKVAARSSPQQGAPSGSLVKSAAARFQGHQFQPT